VARRLRCRADRLPVKATRRHDELALWKLPQFWSWLRDPLCRIVVGCMLSRLSVRGARTRSLRNAFLPPMNTVLPLLAILNLNRLGLLTCT